MLDKEVIDASTLYPSALWETFCKERSIFSCVLSDKDIKPDFQLKFICHYIETFGNIRLRLVAEKIKRHLIAEENFANKKKSEINFIATHDERLLGITRKIFKEIYAYTTAIKERVEKLYECRLELMSENETFEQFLKVHFSSTEE